MAIYFLCDKQYAGIGNKVKQIEQQKSHGS